MLGMPELKKDPRFADPVQVQKPENAEQLEAILTAWLMDHTIIEVWQAAQAAHVISGPVYSFANLLKDDHFRQRGFWEAIEHPRAGRLEYPGRPFFSPGAPRVARRPAPTLGQHTAQVLAEVTSRQPQAGSRPAAAPEKTTRLPLEGIRVADLTVVLAGTNATTLLADWGAEVVRVEPINRFQPITRGTLPRPSQELINANRNWIAAYPGWKPGPRPWNCWPHFNAHARNKLSMTLNIERPGGLDVLRELVRVSDVVIENNVPETIDKLGIGYEALRRVRPDIVMIRMPAYGLSGPYANYRSLGAHLEGTAGHTYIRGYPDTDPSERDDVYFGDAVAAATAAAAVLMVLHRRQRTGEGCLIEAAQCECLVPFFGDMLLDYQMNGRVAQPAANDLYKMAPHNTYPCKGDDQWVAIAVGTEDEWRGLLQAMGKPAWGMDSRFATKASRFEHRRELDALVDAWTSQHEARWVMETLQARGVPCGVLNDEPGAFADPQLNARGFFETLTHADCGKHRYPGIIWRMAETPNHIRRPPCRLGEHNDWAYGELLGVAPARLAALREAGHIGMDYHPSVT
jgi:crotonobetainyl-CoA:carnitine CoA-transferase CaiB-like acyl-CoA transferase